MTKEYIISGYHKIITVANSCKRVKELDGIKDWIDNFIDRTLPYYDKMTTQDKIDIMANKVLCLNTKTLSQEAILLKIQLKKKAYSVLIQVF